MKFLSSLLLFIAPVALALPTSVITEAPVEQALDARQCYVTCGSTCYTSAQVTAARNRGYSLYQSGSQAGSYPHTYNNYEGFDFLVTGPYQEFPLKTSGLFTGSSPGADRVIFNTRGQRAGEITHTGASGNNFVACSGW
ncbi:Nn.00g102760.m01.CDS01 [Neocucurbitaria sp. VM-36]